MNRTKIEAQSSNRFYLNKFKKQKQKNYLVGEKQTNRTRLGNQGKAGQDAVKLDTRGKHTTTLGDELPQDWTTQGE